MSSFDARKLQDLYNSFAQAEYQTLLMKLAADLSEQLNPLPLKYQIKARVKDFSSYFKKISTKSTADTAGITDFLGMRIICPFLDDLTVVEKTLLEHFPIREVDHKGERQSFREFGYDSIHLLLDLQGQTVPHPLPMVDGVCEIQLRTLLQDAWAEVEHDLIYKSDWSIPTDQIRRKLAALNANLTLSDIIFQELRDFQKEIVLKQDKRRSIQNARTGILSSHELRQQLGSEPQGDDDKVDLGKIILKALTAHAEEDFSRAIRLYSRALKLPAEIHIRSILLNHRGMAYFALGENNAAKADFRSAKELDEGNFRAWYNLGLAHKVLQEFDRAIEAFAKSSELHPGFFESAEQRIRLLMDLGLHSEARNVFGILQKHHPDAPEVRLLQKEIMSG
ncbi:MAG: tetratricopeptide repeat protein [Deltaproteobacteria bacterium]|nr:tetratricopeptide repeat protein [Candidatus Anaeroferrophillus wilburensis]MBN2889737.1 tetratricopeptide repeat protein [Deltaproteobacteria bacterium]